MTALTRIFKPSLTPVASAHGCSRHPSLIMPLSPPDVSWPASYVACDVWISSLPGLNHQCHPCRRRARSTSYSLTAEATRWYATARFGAHILSGLCPGRLRAAPVVENPRSMYIPAIDSLTYVRACASAISSEMPRKWPISQSEPASKQYRLSPPASLPTPRRAGSIERWSRQPRRVTKLFQTPQRAARDRHLPRFEDLMHRSHPVVLEKTSCPGSGRSWKRRIDANAVRHRRNARHRRANGGPLALYAATRVGWKPRQGQHC